MTLVYSGKHLISSGRLLALLVKAGAERRSSEWLVFEELVYSQQASAHADGASYRGGRGSTGGSVLGLVLW